MSEAIHNLTTRPLNEPGLVNFQGVPDAAPIRVSRKLPDGVANLAYIHGEEIGAKDISIVQEKIPAIQRDVDPQIMRVYVHYPFDFNALDFDDLDFGNEQEEMSVLSEFCDASGAREYRHGYAMMTSEFSIPLSSNDTPVPLFYYSELSKNIDIQIWGKSAKLVAYPRGHVAKTEEELSLSPTITGRIDATPMVYREIQETGSSALISLSKKDGTPIRNGFKILLMPGTIGWSVAIYHSFSPNEEISVRYCGMNGRTHVEPLGFSPLYDYGDDFQIVDQQNGYFKIEKETDAGQVIEGPFRHDGPVQFRISGRVSRQYGSDNPLKIKVGMLYLDVSGETGGSSFPIEETRLETASLFAELHKNTQGFIPDYVTFENPHPASIYVIDETLDNQDNLEAYKAYRDYWWVDPTMPTEHWLDYDLIYVSGGGLNNLRYLAETFRQYIDNGGRLLFDGEYGSSGSMRIKLGFDPDLPSFDTDEDGSETSKTLPPTLPFLSKVYDLGDATVAEIGLYGGDCHLRQIQGNPEAVVPFGPEWTTLLANSAGDKLILERRGIHGRGRVVLSSVALASGILTSGNTASGQYLTNLLIYLMEDCWVATPWLTTTVLPAQLLRNVEFEKEGYRMDTDPTDPSGPMVARKQIAEKAINFVNFYTRQKDTSGTFYAQHNRPNDVYMDPVLSGDSPLEIIHFDTIRDARYTEWDAEYQEYAEDTLYSQVTTQAIIVPYAQKWVASNGQLILKTVEADYKHCRVVTSTISKADGIVNLGGLAQLLPPLPQGYEWADKDKVYYKIYGWDDDLQEKASTVVTYGFYNQYSGEHYYSSMGEYQISHREIYGSRVVTVNGRTVERANSEDIVLYAQTDAYGLCRYADMYAVRPVMMPENVVSLAATLSTNECWFPLVHRMSFVKDNFTESDYERIAKVVGFKYDPQYLIEQARSYFGRIPADNAVAKSIGLLSGGAEIGWNDLQVLLDAIRVIEPGWVYQYYTPEYYALQAWEDGEPPFKTVTDETPMYVDNHTVRVGRFPMIGLDQNRIIHPEKVTLLYANEGSPGTYAYQLPDKNIDPTSPVVVVVDDMPIFPDDLAYPYVIDYAAGVILFTAAERPILSGGSYTVKNVTITRQTHKTINTKAETQTLAPNRMYSLSNPNLRLLPNPVPVVADATRTLTPAEYWIDYAYGIIYPNVEIIGELTVTGNCEKMEVLGIEWIDTQNGVIRLKNQIHFHDDLRISYRFYEERYEYRGYIDEVSGVFVGLDLNPTRGHLCTVASDDIYRTAIPEADARLNERNGWMDVETYQLVDKSVYLYMYPYKTYFNGTQVGETRTSTLRHTWSKESLESIQLAHPEVLVLAEIRVTDPWTVFDTVVMDARTEGGADATERSLDKYSRWDINPIEGLEIHPNGTAVVRLPKSVLVRNGGNFTEQEVEQVVREHMAAGVIPVILYEDITNKNGIFAEEMWSDIGSWTDEFQWP